MNIICNIHSRIIIAWLVSMLVLVPVFEISAATSAQTDIRGQAVPSSNKFRTFVVRPNYTVSLDRFDDSSRNQLDKLLEVLKVSSVSSIEVIGHTDSTQIRQRSRRLFPDNRALSFARASVVAAYINNKLQLDDENVVVKGYGNGLPVAKNATRKGRLLNRRIEIIAQGEFSNAPALAISPVSQPPVYIAPSRKVPSVKHDINLTLKNVDIVEVMAMLSRKERVNILLSKDVKGEVSLNLYDVSLEQAIKTIASAAGYAVERRHGSYFIVGRNEAGKYTNSGITKLRTFKVQYSDSKAIEGILRNHLSSYGKVTTLPDRNLLVVEDTPDFLNRIESLLAEIDKKPSQILIEAKILEVSLNDSETFGVEWRKLFNSDGGGGAFGTNGFSASGATGFFLDLVTPNVEVALNALSSEGRVRTLSTPKLLALENQEASVVIGDRIGYRLTTTINQVTTESVEFLESGVILKVKPSVDGQGQIMLDIHPEVSTGTVLDGIPSQTTTEVSTQLLVQDGQTVFIGGLIKRSTSESRDSVPVLGDIPVLGGIFSSNGTSSINTETVVMITPHIVKKHDAKWSKKQVKKVDNAEKILQRNVNKIDEKIEDRYPSEIEEDGDDYDIYD